ncbi:MAG: hypothetical protein Q9211_007055 [Gyalolechia sp. 1 TL-2023]
MCSAATTRFDLFDPYLERETFHRYLPDFTPTLRVRVVTSKDLMEVKSLSASPTQNAIDKFNEATQRRDRVVAVSELLAMEYPDQYEFLVSGEQHDRHIRVDDEIIHLGGSMKDAGKSRYFTISPIDPNELNHTILDGIIKKSDVWYGPTNKKHRKS